MVKKQIEMSIKEYLETLKAKNIRVQKAILYGSLADGTADEDSDIDLAIVSPDLGRDRFKEAIMHRTFHIPTVLLPKSAKPGNIINIQITVDKDATKTRTQSIDKIADSLFEDGGR